MLVRQSKNSFIRLYDNGKLGYINNQLTKYDRMYDENGAIFLSQISRTPKSINEILDELSKIYPDVDRHLLTEDFLDFVTDLAEQLFLVIGHSVEELDEKDLSFSYSLQNPKTLTDYFPQKTKNKVNRDTEEYLLHHDQDKPRLGNLQFELTSRCNERCIHCYIPNGKKNTGFDMSFEKFKYILDQYVDMGGLCVTLSGGEALMNKDILDILRYCRIKDLQISLLTNLISLKEEQIPILKEVNLSIIQVSLYSMNPEIHDAITTVRGSFGKTKAAIEKLFAADIPVQISCPVMKANKDGYGEVMKYAQSMRMKAQTDYIMMAQADLDTSNLANRISLEETGKVIRDIMELDVDYQTETLTQEPLSSISEEEFAEMPLCGAGLNDLCVTVNGDIYPCSGWQDFVVGNVFKDSLQSIWEDSLKLKQIRNIKQKDFPKCLNCEARDFCNMCLVRNYNESNGDMFKINEHFCKVAFLNKSIAEEWLQSHKKDKGS
ncbi:MAG: radical SAM protein [Prevotella sp.]|nr:radical SAM protein [Prevotella sp.]